LRLFGSPLCQERSLGTAECAPALVAEFLGLAGAQVLNPCILLAADRVLVEEVLRMPGLRGWTCVLAASCAAAMLGGGAAGAPPAAVAGVAESSCTSSQVVATWSLRRLAEQTLVVPAQETAVSAVTTEVEAGVGGVLLFGSEAPSDLGAQLAQLDAKARGGIAPLVMTDEEGGAVQRMANLVGWMPSARTMAATRTLTEVRRLARRVGGRMLDAGVTMNLAPVLDLDDGPGPSSTNPDGTRSFSLSPDLATRYGLAFADGMRAAGVVTTVKHFPGLGQATANTDYAPARTRSWSWLKTHGLLPFKAAVRHGLPAVMVTTARVPGLTALPATLSRRAVHGVLRTGLGFHGLVLTDSLTGGAVVQAGFTLSRASVRALRAGADMVLFNARPREVAATTDKVVRAIVRAVRNGDLSARRLRAAVTHVLRAKQASGCG
jgi:beta-N-acetylhexosaminidase